RAMKGRHLWDGDREGAARLCGSFSGGFSVGLLDEMEASSGDRSGSGRSFSRSCDLQFIRSRVRAGAGRTANEPLTAKGRSSWEPSSCVDVWWLRGFVTPVARTG